MENAVKIEQDYDFAKEALWRKNQLDKLLDASEKLRTFYVLFKSLFAVKYNGDSTKEDLEDWYNGVESLYRKFEEELSTVVFNSVSVDWFQLNPNAN